MDEIEQLRGFAELKKALSGKTGINTGVLEQNFLDFMSYLPEREFIVRMPPLYALKGDEKHHLDEALRAFGLDPLIAPNSVDISGAFDLQTLGDNLIFFGLRQCESDHYSDRRSYLNPVIEQAYINALTLIRDFSVHEAVIGKVECTRGDLSLREAHLFPERFNQGPYKITAVLDTSKRTISRFMELCDLLDEFEQNPKSSLLDRNALEEASSVAVSLRQLLGSLSRYDRPAASTIVATSNSYVVRTGSATLFYLYSPDNDQNVVVTFGDNPFKAQSSARGLVAIDGEQRQHALQKLMELGIFEPSIPVLERRVKDLVIVYEGAARSTGTNIQSQYGDFTDLIGQLQKANATLGEIVNPEMRKRYAMRLDPELLEFLAYAPTKDPVVHQLLPRLSWSSAIRAYHNTGYFLRTFTAQDEQGRTTMLRDVQSDFLFQNQQNNDINLWLYQNHRDFCKNLGIKFKVE